MYPTKNDLSEGTRREMIELCNARLADAIDLQTQTKQAHWNVKGPHFIALHELFDKVNEDVEDYVDLIAERAVQPGETVDATVRPVATLARRRQVALDGRGTPRPGGVVRDAEDTHDHDH